MHVFVAQLRTLCATHPTRAKWVIVPTHAAGRMMGDRLALGGTSWANVRLVTPLDLALRMAAPFLVERGIDPSEDGLGPALMMRLLLDLPDAASYFRPLADQPQMAIALWGTLRELRMAGIRSTDVAGATFSSPAKHDEVTALLDSYERFLDTNSRGDRATVFEEALRHPDWCPVLPPDCWMEWPGAIWSVLERRVIDALPGERIAPAFPGAGLALPRRLASLASGPSASVPQSHASVSFFHAGGSEAEVEEVFRRILGDGTPIDQVEITCASDRYVSLIWEKALRHEWNVTLAAGLPATLTRPGRALLGFAEWVEDDFSAGRLRRLLQSGDVRIQDEDLSAARAARLLVKARAAWGRDTYQLALGRMAAGSRRHAARGDVPDDERERSLQRAEEADRLAMWIAGLVDAVPVPDASGQVQLQDVVTAAAAFVQSHAARASALDHLAVSRLGAAVAELRALGAETCTLPQAWRFIRERVESVAVGSDRARPGHLFVSKLQETAVSGRSAVFVVGLEEGRVFPSAFEDPVLLDAERRALHPGLRVSTDVVDEAVYAVVSRLTALMSTPDTTLTLSYSCRDLRQFRETYASWVMLHVYRLVSGDATKGYADLHAMLGAPSSCVPSDPARAPGIGRWWMHGVTRGDAAAGRVAVLGQHQMLAAGVAATTARCSSAFTEFDGHVPAAGAVLDPCRPEVVVSPTQLEDAASCAFRYFLRRGLKIDAIETGERDRDVWLDPLVRGSLLHDLYARLLRRCREAGRKVQVSLDRAWMQAEGARTLDDLAVEMPPPSAEVGVRERRELLEDLDLFVEREADAAPLSSPLAFEVAFGRGASGDVEPLSNTAPVVVQAGGVSIRIAGRVDRIDELPDGTFEIIDYKTGRYYDKAWEGTFAGGRRLQHALYGLAAVELLKRVATNPKVSAAQYYFPSRKGRLERKRIPAQSAALVGKVVADLREVISEGLFIHTTEQEDCRFCDYGPACGADAHTHAGQKLGDHALAAYRRLGTHE
jgi:RecB family exonuclease